jgi:hypothetical protein
MADKGATDGIGYDGDFMDRGEVRILTVVQVGVPNGQLVSAGNTIIN